MRHTKTYIKLLSEWSPRNDRPLDSYKSYSSEKVWWVCENGHEWLASIKGRFSSHGCPYCSGKIPVKGENDCATLKPELLSEWHPTKNGNSQLSDYTKGSEKEAWWICSEGHEWKTKINYRMKGSGCPVCNRKIPHINDNLLVRYPQVAANWNYEKNSLPPEKYRPHSSSMIFWKCAQGHEWIASIHEMTNQRRLGSCPFCSGHRPIIGETDLATMHPDIASEWDFERNEKSPSDYTENSNQKVYWVCEQGHRYAAIIANRVKGRGCSLCHRGW